MVSSPWAQRLSQVEAVRYSVHFYGLGQVPATEQRNRIDRGYLFPPGPSMGVLWNERVRLSPSPSPCYVRREAHALEGLGKVPCLNSTISFKRRGFNENSIIFSALWSRHTAKLVIGWKSCFSVRHFAFHLQHLFIALTHIFGLASNFLKVNYKAS
jgi:hypothetical protein